MPTNQFRNDALLDAAGVNTTLAAKVKAVLSDVRGHGKQVLITEVLRSADRQRFLYAKGRTDLQLKNRGYTPAAIAKARGEGAKATDHQVTWSLKSRHIEGEAADLVPVRNGQPDWGDSETYALIGSSAKAHELDWGGTWKSKDMPHVQL